MLSIDGNKVSVGAVVRVIALQLLNYLEFDVICIGIRAIATVTDSQQHHWCKHVSIYEQ